MTDPDTAATVPTGRSHTRTLVRIAGVAAALAVLWVLGRRLGGYIPQFAQWVDGLGIWGPIVFALGYAAATVAFIPGSLLTLAAGAIFGLLKGTAVVLVGATLGAVAAFLIGRTFARAAIERRLAGNARFAAIDRAIGKQGLKIAFLLRLSPVFPFNLLNYGLGLTGVTLRDYALACLGMVPGTFLYVFLGRAAGSLAGALGGAQPEGGGAGRTITLIVGLAATAVVTVIITRIARRALAQEVPE